MTMSEPLTDNELQMLLSLGSQLRESNPSDHAGEADQNLVDRAVEEIRKLRADIDRRDESTTHLSVLHARGIADNTKLRQALKDYGRHKNRCGWSDYGPCDCGLDDALAARAKGE